MSMSDTLLAIVVWASYAAISALVSGAAAHMQGLMP